MKNREKEINELLYLKSELIKQTKKEIKALRQEKDMINGYKRLEKTKVKRKKQFAISFFLCYNLFVSIKYLHTPFYSFF